MLETIKMDEIKDFITESLQVYTESSEPSDKANKVAEVVLGILEERGLVSEHSNQTFVDVLIAAALLHDVFQNETAGFLWVFQARNDLSGLADANSVPKQIQDAIFDAIEGQLGERMPVAKSRPQPGTPQEMFSYAVWFVNKYLV